MARPDKQVHVLYKDNDLVARVHNLRNGETGVVYNDATILFTLYDAAGAEVIGEAWPRVMEYVEGSHGAYRAGLEETIQLVPNARYTAVFSVDAGGGLKGKWTLPCVCRVRR